MSTAVIKLDKNLGVNGFPKTKGRKEKIVAAPVFIADRKKSVLKKWLFRFGLLTLFCTSVFGTVFYHFYSQAETSVNRRIKAGFWQTRSGIYAAPHVLKPGQKIKTAELIAILRHSGYVEGENRNVWNGNFSVKGDTISVQTNHSGDEVNEPEITTLEIADGKIAKIQNGSRTLEAFELQPEMISGGTAEKRDSINTLKYEQIPETLRNAILVTEDRRFFEHRGIDPRGIFRALFRNVSENGIKQGGSTITQQFVKNIFLSGERTFGRKFSELFLALALENKLSKEAIFSLYCNEIYLGQHGVIGIHGVEQASRSYFGKKIENLTLAEYATLAAMIKSPNRYAPNRNPDAAKERRNLVIQKMSEAGMISQTEAEKAKAEEIALADPSKHEKSIAPYFVDAVLKDISGEKLPQRNLRVYTTIDPQMQEMAENSVNSELAKLDKAFAKKGIVPQASLVAIDPRNGHVLAMVGGRDYAASQLNRATEAHRQPGSTFKPFVYATALEQGKLPTSIISDRPTAFSIDRKPYKPANYGNSYAMSDISLKTALAKSSNVAAVEVALETGLGSIAATAGKLGLRVREAFPSMALGTEEVTPLELAAAYAAFVNQGRRVKPVFVSQIISGEGALVYKNEEKDAPVISPQTAYMITDMLGAAVERGTARAAKNALGKDVAFVGKTGSSKDGWFVGYTPNLVCAVWIGFDENEDIGFTGGEIALPVWVDFMKKVTQARPEFGGRAFPMPAGLAEITIDPETGMIADEYCLQREKVVVPAKSISNLECLRHQPKTDVLLSLGAQYSQSEPKATESLQTIEIEEEMTVESKDVEQYKSINGVPFAPDEKNQKINVETPNRKVTVEIKNNLRTKNENLDSTESDRNLRAAKKAVAAGGMDDK